MSEDFVGCQVSVEVRGGLGWYQGRVVGINIERQTLTLTRVIHNGKPAPLAEVTINAGDVLNLKILSQANKDDVNSSSSNATTRRTGSTTAKPTPTSASSSSSAHRPTTTKATPSTTAARIHAPHTPVAPHSHTHTSPAIPPQQAQQSLSNQTQQKKSPVPSPSPSQPQPQKQQATTPKNFSRPQQQVSQTGVGEVGAEYGGTGAGSGAGAGTGAGTRTGPGAGTGTDPGQIRRKPRASVGETLAHGSHSRTPPNNEWQRGPYTPLTPSNYSSPRRSDQVRMSGKKERQQRARNEATFGTPNDELMDTEFDFESNLALFDKQAVYEEIQSHKPDVVRQTVRENYRYDENVLPSKPPPERHITVPTTGAAEVIYANDSGVLVPSVTSELRAALLSTANQHGLTNSRQLEMVGRAATEVIMSMSGCSHRLDPGSSQKQPPLVVLLCGSHLQGAAGVNTARQLECQGVQTVVVTPPGGSLPPTPLLLTHELQLYALTGGRTVADPRVLPSTLDLIVDARLDHSGKAGESSNSKTWLNSVTAWASASRAPVLALDPPSDLAALPSAPQPLAARVLLCVALPLAYTPSRGKLYLLSLPIPLHIFVAVGIKYVSPFGAKLVIPLHPYE